MARRGGGWSRGARGRRGSAAAVGLALLSLAAGCSRRPAEKPAGLGRLVAKGPARALRPSPDGRWLAWLGDCERPVNRMLPPEVYSCDLLAAPVEGGEARRVARRVTTLEVGFAWSAGGKLAALAGYDYATATGALVLDDLREAAGPRELAPEVGFYAFGAGEELAYVSRGQFFVAAAGGDPRPVPGASGISSFELPPRGEPAAAGGAAADGGRAAGGGVAHGAEAAGGGGPAALLRRARAAGGALLAVPAAWDRTVALAERSGDYGFAPGGEAMAWTVDAGARSTLHVAWVGAAAAAPGSRKVDGLAFAGPPVGAAIQSFRFAPGGGKLAFVADLEPGRAGNLYVVGPRGKPLRVADRVGEYRWSGDGGRLAWLENYDPRVRVGVLGIAAPGSPPVRFGKNVSDFDLTRGGDRAAWLEHVTAGNYSVDLKLAGADAASEPRTVARGAFGFSFSPDGAWLYYRSSCVRNAEACDLHRIPAAGLAEGTQPERVAEGVKSFEFDRRNAGRLLVSWARKDMAALDLAVWQGGRLIAVDNAAVPGTAAFLGPDSARLAYAVAAKGREGVYVAELPPP